MKSLLCLAPLLALSSESDTDSNGSTPCLDAFASIKASLIGTTQWGTWENGSMAGTLGWLWPSESEQNRSHTWVSTMASSFLNQGAFSRIQASLKNTTWSYWNFSLGSWHNLGTGDGNTERGRWNEAHISFLRELSTRDSALYTMVQRYCEYTIRLACSEFSGTLEACTLTLSHGAENAAAAVEQLIRAARGTTPKFPTPTADHAALTAVWCSRLVISQTAAASSVSDHGHLLSTAQSLTTRLLTQALESRERQRGHAQQPSSCCG